jgi:hypothetical protein
MLRRCAAFALVRDAPAFKVTPGPNVEVVFEVVVTALGDGWVIGRAQSGQQQLVVYPRCDVFSGGGGAAWSGAGPARAAGRELTVDSVGAVVALVGSVKGEIGPTSRMSRYRNVPSLRGTRMTWAAPWTARPSGASRWSPDVTVVGLTHP